MTRSAADSLRAKVPDIDKHMLLSELEVSELTGIPRGTLSRWRCAGKGPTYVKWEGTVRYYLSDILSYADERKRLSVRASMEGTHVAQTAR
jgi:hypothetical protein